MVCVEVYVFDEFGLDCVMFLCLVIQDMLCVFFFGCKLGCFEFGCEVSFLLLGDDLFIDFVIFDMLLLCIKQGWLLICLVDVVVFSVQVIILIVDLLKRFVGKKKVVGKVKFLSKVKWC